MKKICKWCGSKFSTPNGRQYNAVKYCSDDCRYYAYLEKHLEAVRRYNKKNYKKVIASRLGTGKLGSHPQDDWEKELKLIQNELKRCKIK